MRFSRGTRTICEGCDCRKMAKSNTTVVFYAAKDRQTIAGVRKRRQLLAGVVFSSAGISTTTTKILANVSRIPVVSVLLVICSQTCYVLKLSFVIMQCAGPTQDVRDVRKIFVNPQPDHDSLQNVSRKQRSSPDYLSTYSRTVRVLLLMTINLRMSQSIPELHTNQNRHLHERLAKVLRTHLTSGQARRKQFWIGGGGGKELRGLTIFLSGAHQWRSQLFGMGGGGRVPNESTTN